MLPGTPMLSHLAAPTATPAYFCPRNFNQARWTRPISPSLSGSIPTKTPPRENNHSFPSAQSSSSTSIHSQVLRRPPFSSSTSDRRLGSDFLRHEFLQRDS